MARRAAVTLAAAFCAHVLHLRYFASSASMRDTTASRIAASASPMDATANSMASAA